MSWREMFAPLIAKVIEENAGASNRTLRRALKAAYPANLPKGSQRYRIWCEEVIKQTGGKIHANYADLHDCPPNYRWKSKAWTDPVPPGRLLDDPAEFDVKIEKPRTRTAGGN